MEGAFPYPLSLFQCPRHVNGSSTPANDADTHWLKREGLFKLWIHGTLAQPLLKSSFKAGGTARDIWLCIENQFQNNKETRATYLGNNLWMKEISDLSIQEYSQSIKYIADLLQNVEAHVSDKTLFMYMLNRINEKFNQIINVIKHHRPFLSFD